MSKSCFQVWKPPHFLIFLYEFLPILLPNLVFHLQYFDYKYPPLNNFNYWNQMPLQINMNYIPIWLLNMNLIWARYRNEFLARLLLLLWRCVSGWLSPFFRLFFLLLWNLSLHLFGIDCRLILHLVVEPCRA